MKKTTKDWIVQGESVLMPNYSRFPLLLKSSQGATIIDHEGHPYLDFVSGIAVNSLGHGDSQLIGALQKQAETLLHVSNLYYTIPQIELAARLVNHSFADKVFFCNSGAEAVEAAIKLARKHAKDAMPGGRFEIIAAENAFHGRTLAALSATGQSKYHHGFEPLLPGFKHVPFDDAGAIEAAITPHTAAVLLEPIQGEGGVRIPKPGYLSSVRRLCDRHGILLIFDEVQTGMGRTGNLFAYEAAGIEPDIMTLAKGLGGGIPIGALLAKDTVAQSFQPGSHASTFGGNPLACTAGIVVIDRLTRDDAFLASVRQKGDSLLKGLEALGGKTPLIKALRGRGLMAAVDLGVPALDVIEAGQGRGLLLNRTSEYTLRLIPPLTIQRAEIDRMLETLSDILMERTDAEA
ncbi:MAG: acetylornithine transaminase [Nitrospiria bacterium]